MLARKQVLHSRTGFEGSSSGGGVDHTIGHLLASLASGRDRCHNGLPRGALAQLTQPISRTAKEGLMTSIGIVGTGISGLTLALTLQQAGVDTTLYAEKTPDEMRAGRLPNTVVRFGPTVARERALGVEHWDSVIEALHVSILDTPLAFYGRVAEPACAVDFRIFLPRLLEDYAERGGRVHHSAMGPDDVVARSADHDLTVVAAGRDAVGAFFPRDEERSAHTAPRRIICSAFYRGVAALEPHGGSMSLAPGVGEVFTFPFISRHDGPVTAVFVEAIPGGPLEPIARADQAADPAAFDALALDLIRRYAPLLHDRIDPARWGVTDSRDILQGALTPVVRKPYCEVAPGRFVVAVGDAYVTNDPIVGQGANLGSLSAAVLAEAICEDVAYDEWFCRSLERRLWACAEPVVNFSNALLEPPPPYVEAILGAAWQSQSVADAFIDNFAHPDDMWRAIATLERAATFLAAAGAAAPATPA
jgi:2-polyprenyl-6-methoxyphenol hydroxylase-like FAD-dependent oxidoreductase